MINFTDKNELCVVKIIIIIKIKFFWENDDFWQMKIIGRANGDICIKYWFLTKYDNYFTERNNVFLAIIFIL